VKILSLRYNDHSRGWHLAPTSFGDLTLLVGISGVGKTQILQAIRSLAAVARGQNAPGVEWEISFLTQDGDRYEWSGKFELGEGTVSFPFRDILDEEERPPKCALTVERLLRNGEVVLERDSTGIFLDGRSMPKLSQHESAIHILREEDSLRAAHKSFKRIVHSDHVRQSGFMMIQPSHINRWVRQYDTPEKLRDAELETFLKLAVAYQVAPDLFAEICERFRSVFPQVEEIRLTQVENPDELPHWFRDALMLQIRERAVGPWILQQEMSSGMYRTILQIAELFLSRDGTVVLIDEFENSLGVNCIDVLTEDLVGAQRSLQFILTSHHPYIINNIGIEHWKIVTREGGSVSTHDASEFDIGASRHDAFLQLINTPAFLQGVPGA
jgi:predicted ATPase